MLAVFGRILQWFLGASGATDPGSPVMETAVVAIRFTQVATIGCGSGLPATASA
jgi:hypothetical protein